MSNVIYRGPVHREPQTITAPVAATLKPGVAVTLTGGKFAVAADPKGRWLILNNRRFYGQTITDAYTVDESAVAFRVEGEHEFNVQLAAAASYSHGDALTFANGVFKKAATADLVVAAFDGKDGTAITAGQLGDIVILSTPYVMP